MSAGRRGGGRWGPVAERAVVREVRTLDETRESIAPALSWWGYVARPDEIRFLRRRGAEWRRLLGDSGVVEARIFHPGADLHWVDGRGVVIEAVGKATRKPDAPEGIAIEGADWRARDRRSRLWGEYLDGSEGWYEEGIPDLWRYEGVPADRGHLYVFLRYREYVRRGVVEFVRFLGLEGGRR